MANDKGGIFDVRGNGGFAAKVTDFDPFFCGGGVSCVLRVRSRRCGGNVCSSSNLVYDMFETLSLQGLEDDGRIYVSDEVVERRRTDSDKHVRQRCHLCHWGFLLEKQRELCYD